MGPSRCVGVVEGSYATTREVGLVDPFVLGEQAGHLARIEYIASIASNTSIGTPDFLLGRFRRLESLGSDKVLVAVDGMGHEADSRSIEAVGKFVVPEPTI